MFRTSFIFSDLPDSALLPTPTPYPGTANEKYEMFLNQARKNTDKDYNKCETLDHFDIITEEVPEDEPAEVRQLRPARDACAEGRCVQSAQKVCAEGRCVQSMWGACAERHCVQKPRGKNMDSEVQKGERQR